MEELLLSSLYGTASKMIEDMMHFIFRIFMICALLLLISLVLPNDPFQNSIIKFSGTFAQWSALINYFIPVKFIISSGFFFVLYKYFIYVYKLICAEYLQAVSSTLKF